jgi:VanZ family protein
VEDVAPRRPPDRSAVSTWAPVAGYCALIVAISSLPASALPASRSIWDHDKLIHAAEYAVLAALIARALGRRGRSGPGAAVAAFALAAAFGVLDELYQTTTPGRAATAADAVADALGALVGAAGRWMWSASTSRRGRADEHEHEHEHAHRRSG